MSDLTDYEEARLANIRKNNELLQSLGLSTGASAIFEPVQDKPKPKPKPIARPNPSGAAGGKVKRENAGSEDEDVVLVENAQTRRSSGRRSAGAAPVYNLMDLSRPSRRNRHSDPSPSEAKGKGKATGNSLKRQRTEQPRPSGSRVSARLQGAQPSHSYTELSDSEDSSRDDDLARNRFSKLAKVQGPRMDENEDIEGRGAYEEYERKPRPRLYGSGVGGKGRIIFEDRWKIFTPNLTPEEMMRGGMFGGTAFRRHRSAVTGRWLEPEEELAALPKEWLDNIDVENTLTREDYDPSVNRFGVKASQSLAEWEKAGWVRPCDPRGWWGWYISFYLGRRCSDDARQINRWLKAVGPNGRFKRSLIRDVANSRSQRWNDESIAPVVRQTCWHWAVELTKEDYEEAVRAGL
ncbi:hypothetical protein OC846_002944 [Tilletia horrida]|uniref:Uncharacterized protein n=1 Tax=Tilletia horrida TaxID=155126 RepID=A0AAN6GPY3_9BASI|nr:hypothetical protein OC846_002944 [Tilletia horrida]KAK0566873.1 hypothetical protein OC861_002995 [Tilletia horrida]